MDIQKIRVQHLQALIKAKGGAAALAREYDDINPSYISQLINEMRPFGEKSARNLEKKLNLKNGYFDETAQNQDVTALIAKQTQAVYNSILIEGTEIKTNEHNLLLMYTKLSPESKEMVDYLTNKLYAKENPLDKVASPFGKSKNKRKREN